jgi:hypothetical protein
MELTAEEFLVKNKVLEKPELSNFNLMLSRDAHIKTQENIKKAMVEFAKYHVEQALKEAVGCVNIYDYAENKDYSKFLEEDSILNAYLLENIK